VSRPPARHRKTSRPPSAAAWPQAGRPRHRKPSALRSKPAKVTASAALAVSAAAGAAVSARHALTTGHPVAGQAEAMSAVPGSAPLATRGSEHRTGAELAGREAAALPAGPAEYAHPPVMAAMRQHERRPPRRQHSHPKPQAKPRPHPAAVPPPYANPLRGVGGLIPERVDMGVDFGGAGPVYALGDGVVTSATGSSAGWPGGGWITYRLTSGPDAGLVVYLAEDVQPTVAVGEAVTPGTVIANMYNGGAGIETGWAMPDGASAESQLPEAGGIGGGGPFPTMIGLSFESLLRSLGVPAAPDAAAAGYGTLPPGYPPA
jgi:hypothetical protein